MFYGYKNRRYKMAGEMGVVVSIIVLRLGYCNFRNFEYFSDLFQQNEQDLHKKNKLHLWPKKPL